MHITEGLRGFSFFTMTTYFVFVYSQYHKTCTSVREWEMKRAGLYDETQFSYQQRWSINSIADYLTFPVAGMMFGSLPLLQAVMSHFWTEKLVYLVSAKPVRMIAHQVGITSVADIKDGTAKDHEKKHTDIV
ncbi:hypothetical protein LPUS_08175 [Lasallia pustulata]|uniref:Uncharacterized protein n=1 Tax=Lasallia pustulata TaxID=136370 RepID=A0A1W5D4M5_9LECA|nr:hypothetical protein LPUS_08175 [Lasallia pustulata]